MALPATLAAIEAMTPAQAAAQLITVVHAARFITYPVVGERVSGTCAVRGAR
jgi:aspartate 1-decarboxylase